MYTVYACVCACVRPCVCESACPKTCRHIARRMHDELLIMKLCMYVVHHDANNVSNFGDDPMTQLNLKKRFIVLFTLFYGYVRFAVTVSAAVATRSPADCSSMESHTSLSTALVNDKHLIYTTFIKRTPRISNIYHVHYAEHTPRIPNQHHVYLTYTIY